MTQWTLGIIGGSGLYALDMLENPAWVSVDTPWGRPSDQVLIGRIGNVNCVFLPRHGRGHPIGPSHLNYRANIDAMKQMGVTDLVSISAVGSLAYHLAPGTFVAVDQFIDRTFARVNSFFGDGIVAHVSFGDPVCPRLSGLAAAAARLAGAQVHEGGTYLAMEGPQFSTRAESLMYQTLGAHVIGMTAMPEAKLAREAELPYALIGMVTDYDCWRDDEAAVDAAAVVSRLRANAVLARALVGHLATSLPKVRTPSPIDLALDTAIITDRAARNPELALKLRTITARVFARENEQADHAG